MPVLSISIAIVVTIPVHWAPVTVIQEMDLTRDTGNNQLITSGSNI